MKLPTFFPLGLFLIASILSGGCGGSERPSSGPNADSASTAASQTETSGKPGATAPETAVAADPAGVLNAPQGEQNTIRLRYAVVLEATENAAPQAPENLTFATGARFKLLLAPASELYLYLIHEGTDGAFSMLHPLPGQATSIDRLTGGGAHSVPLEGWYRFDANTGTERIHVVAAPKQVERIEGILESAESAADSNAIKQALDGVRQRQASGYNLSKNTGTQFSEFTLSGDAIESGALIGAIELKHK